MNSTVSFTYINYKGEKKTRIVKPIKIWFGSTIYHTKKQWLLNAFDIEKNDYRDFAMQDIENWRGVINEED